MTIPERHISLDELIYNVQSLANITNDHYSIYKKTANGINDYIVLSAYDSLQQGTYTILRDISPIR